MERHKKLGEDIARKKEKKTPQPQNKTTKPTSPQNIPPLHPHTQTHNKTKQQ